MSPMIVGCSRKDYSHVWAMFQAVVAHVKSTGERVEAHADPMRLRVGFAAPPCYWEISLTRLKASGLDKSLLDKFATPEGRAGLADLLSQGVVPGA